ncbi:hypothetical protein LUZ60_003809 [Juncus effusus]|nr:hypothetical protein LUZ60_003809 [Juncus effusus]
MDQMAKTQYISLCSSEVMSDPILDYISRILLEEEIVENFNGYQEAPNLQGIEKTFSDILEEKYPSNSHEKDPILTHIEANHSTDSQSEIFTTQIEANHSTDLRSKIFTQESGIESLSTMEFHRGVEEGLKFVPVIDKLTLSLQANKIGNDSSFINPELGEGERRGNKSKNNDGVNMDLLEGRNQKLPMISFEEPIRDYMFDQVLLYHGESHEIKEISSMSKIMQRKAKPRGDEEIHIDLRDLLVSCANALAINARKIAYGLIKEIREHASTNGDSTQRLAFFFVNALDARLAGSGSESYRHLASKRNTIAEYLKAYHIYINASPFYRVSYCFANYAILNATKKSSKIHIIDFGIHFGFQWPFLIQALANNRKGEIIKLRITGVNFPQAGFRPAQRVEEIGKKLKNYAETFNVPFEYQGIASNWEEICIKDLKIEKDEVLIVNTLFQFRRVKDEAFGYDSARNQVLNLIRQIKPHIFIHGVFNATFSPFFLTRFKQALLHYSLFFDIFDTKVPRDNKYREFIEREGLGRDIMNTIACEESDWVHRPETYKQWHVRNLTAGFEPVSMEPDIVKMCSKKMRIFNDRRFFIEENGNWMLQGWKGRVTYALSIWKPKLD